jgi:hypothetical protein
MTYDKSKAPVTSEGYDMVITTSGLVNSIATNGEWSWKEGEGNRGVAFHAVNTIFNQFTCKKGSSDLHSSTKEIDTVNY